MKDIKASSPPSQYLFWLLLSQISVHSFGVQTTTAPHVREMASVKREKNDCSNIEYHSFREKQHINDDIELIIIREMCHMLQESEDAKKESARHKQNGANNTISLLRCMSVDVKRERKKIASNSNPIEAAKKSQKTYAHTHADTLKH